MDIDNLVAATGLHTESAFHLDLNEFSDWLNDGADVDMAGMSGIDDKCPLACYLEAKYHLEAWVDQGGYGFKPDCMYTERLPLWASWFVKLVDQRRGRVTFFQARRILGDALQNCLPTETDEPF